MHAVFVRRPGRAGFTLLELLVAVGVVVLLLGLLLPAVQRARETARQVECRNNLKQIGLALHSYHAQHGALPFGVGPDGPGTGPSVGTLADRRYSAQALLLPFLDRRAVWEQIDFTVAPFHPQISAQTGPGGAVGVNGPAAQVSIDVFLCPSDPDELGSVWGHNNYRACNGSAWTGRTGDGLFGQAVCRRFAQCGDGLSQTAAFSERCKGVWDPAGFDPAGSLSDVHSVWTEPDFRDWCLALTDEEARTLPNDNDGGQTWLEGNMNWTRYNHVLPPNGRSCKNGSTWDGVAMSASARHPGGVNVLLGDGAVVPVSETVDPALWRGLASIDGQEVLDGLF